MTLSAEHADAQGRERARGALASWVQLGVPVGNLAAVGALTGASALLSDETFLTWGWRLPFLVSALLVIVGLWVRLAVAESPLFTAVERPRTPLTDALRTHWRAILLTVGIRICSDVSYYVFAVFALSYLASTLELPKNWGLYGVILGSVLQLAVIPGSAALSDRVGRRPVYVAGAVWVGIWAFVAWPMIDSGNLVGVLVALAVGIAGQGVMYGPMAAFIAELFDTRLRSSGASFGYQVAAIVGGAPAPLIAHLLIDRFHTTFAVTVYVALTAALACVSALLARETRHRRLADDGYRVPRPLSKR